MTTAGRLCSTGITPLPHYYPPHRLPTHQLTRLLIPALPPGYEPQYVGSLRFLDQSFAARCPLSPRQVDPVHALVASQVVLASTSSAVWPLATCVSRPMFGSTCDGLRLTALLSAACATSPGSIPEPASLPALRYLHATGRSYMYNQQFTWQPPFRLLDWPGFA